MSLVSGASLDARTFVSHLECGKTLERYAAATLQGLSAADYPLPARDRRNHVALAEGRIDASGLDYPMPHAGVPLDKNAVDHEAL